MNNQQVQESVESTTYPIMDKSFLQLKLDMQNLHKDIKEFLEGKETLIEYKEDSGQAYEIKRELGEAYANKKGIQNLYGTIRMLVNEHTVQGYTKDENSLKNFLSGLHSDLTRAIHRNWITWDIDRNNREFIIDRIMALTELVLSRTVGDGERRSMIGGVSKSFTNKLSEGNKGFI